MMKGARNAAWLVLAMAALARAAAPPAASDSVSRKEYEQLLREQAQMRQELEQLKAERRVPATSQPASQAASPAGDVVQPVSQSDFDDLDARLRKLGDQVHSALPGTEHLVIAGDAAVGFINQRNTNSTFNANVSPLLLWAPSDRLLFEASFGLGVGTDATGVSSTSINLGIADASFVVNDWLTLGGGLFVVPFGQYHNHFDPPWINQLPDDPLAFGGGGIAPVSEVGIFARGALPARWLPAPFDSKFTYDLYLTNGPGLITNDPTAAGKLNFADFTDLNNGKAVGGRLGFLPFPGVETGYSVEYAQTAPSGFGHVYALLQAADFNWVQEVRPLGGVFRTRAEWVWSNVGRATFDPKGVAGFGPLTFGNWAQGGYAQISYRPTLAANRILKNLEFIFRYDALRTPLKSPGGEFEQRYEFGVDYWLSPAWVLKVAYEIDDKKRGPNQDAFQVQLGVGL
jgi:hypothetical protein